MIINSTIFSTDLMEILQELKRQLLVNQVNLLGKMFDSGDDIMVCCPFHKGGQEKRPSAGIRKSDGLFHCLACGATHSLPEVISYCFGYNDPFGSQGYKWLCKNFSALEVENRETIKLDLARNHTSNKSSILANNNSSELTCVTEEELEQYRYTHPYMYERGLTDAIIDLFDIGYDRNTDAITFPVRSIGGDCLFVARRSVSSKRFDIPKGVVKPLYGLYEVNLFSWQQLARGQPNRLVGVPDIYVCEGLFDCLRLWCNGKFAVAGFGCLFNELQIKQLQELPTRKLILATDSDSAGLNARSRLRRLIKNKIITEVVLPIGRKDIGECTDEELSNLIEVF